MSDVLDVHQLARIARQRIENAHGSTVTISLPFAQALLRTLKAEEQCHSTAAIAFRDAMADNARLRAALERAEEALGSFDGRVYEALDILRAALRPAEEENQ